MSELVEKKVHLIFLLTNSMNRIYIFYWAFNINVPLFVGLFG